MANNCILFSLETDWITIWKLNVWKIWFIPSWVAQRLCCWLAVVQSSRTELPNHGNAKSTPMKIMSTPSSTLVWWTPKPILNVHAVKWTNVPNLGLAVGKNCVKADSPNWATTQTRRKKLYVTRKVATSTRLLLMPVPLISWLYAGKYREMKIMRKRLLKFWTDGLRLVKGWTIKRGLTTAIACLLLDLSVTSLLLLPNWCATMKAGKPRISKSSKNGWTKLSIPFATIF